MDIKKAMEEIARIEKEKAQLELRQAQLSELENELAKRLATLGVNPSELDSEVTRLEGSIREKLESLRTGPIKTQMVRSKTPATSVDDDIMSAIEEQ